MLGYGSTKLQTVLGCFMYILATIMILIAMLNMVVSVIGDSYDKVMTTKVEQDLITRAGLLHDYLEF